MSVYEIPLKPIQQELSVVFPTGVTYGFRLLYLWKPDDCWLLDISDSDGNPMVCGIPLVTGVDLLAQYAYLNFGCKLYCTTDGANPTEVPKFYNLGLTSHVWLSD